MTSPRPIIATGGGRPCRSEPPSSQRGSSGGAGDPSRSAARRPRTRYLPTTIIEEDELFLLQRSSAVEALGGGNIVTESINHVVSGRMATALGKHDGVAREALEFSYEHVGVGIEAVRWPSRRFSGSWEVEGDSSDRAVRILAEVARTDEEQRRGLLAMRRAVTARRICADGMYEAFVASSSQG